MKMSLAVLLAAPLAAASPGAPQNPGVSLATSTTMAVDSQRPAEASTILSGAELRTEWVKTRNPFRFEVSDAPDYTPERLEQIQVLGFSKMPDATGFLRTYAFVAKTTEGVPRPGDQPEPATTREIHILEALPEKIDADTLPTEEQTEASLISLGNEPLWFLGLLQTNQQTLAVFLPDHAPYPIQEENLRCFEVLDSLKDLHIRETRAGKKISAEANLPRLIRSSPKQNPLRPDATPSSSVGDSLVPPEVSSGTEPSSRADVDPEPTTTPQIQGTNAMSKMARP